MNRLRLFGGVCLALGLILAETALGNVARADADDVVCVDVQVRGSTQPSCSLVFENPNQLSSPGVTVFAVHGFTRTAASWEGMADALFADPVYKWVLGRVIAIDLPGRGETPAVPGVYGDDQSVFGTLVIQDNVSIIIQTLQGLPAEGYTPTVLMGHSMGGLEVQGVQEALLAQGSSLAAIGVNKAILLAPVPHAGAQWNIPTTGDLSPYVIVTPEYGPVLALNGTAGLFGGGFTKLSDGNLASTVPLAWLAPGPNGLPVGIPSEWLGWEPLTLALQLTTPNRPAVRDGAFKTSNGTVLTLLTFAQDVLTPTVNHPALYEQLVGKKPGKNFVQVQNADAVHESITVAPAVVVTQLRLVPNLF